MKQINELKEFILERYTDSPEQRVNLKACLRELDKLIRQDCIPPLIQTDVHELRCLSDLLIELKAAQMKHPDWPNELIHQAAIVAEESGELIRACLQIEYENAQFDDCRKEAKQTGAMALRFLINNTKKGDDYE